MLDGATNSAHWQDEENLAYSKDQCAWARARLRSVGGEEDHGVEAGSGSGMLSFSKDKISQGSHLTPRAGVVREHVPGTTTGSVIQAEASPPLEASLLPVYSQIHGRINLDRACDMQQEW